MIELRVWGTGLGVGCHCVCLCVYVCMCVCESVSVTEGASEGGWEKKRESEREGGG